MAKLLEFKDFSLGFKDDDGNILNLLDSLSFSIEEGKGVGIVGESGCGKSITSLAAMGLLPGAAVIQGGEILFKGENLSAKTESEMEHIRGKNIAMIFQEPMTSLNPVLTIGFQIGEMLKRHHLEMSEAQIEKAVLAQLALVGIPSPEKRYNQYPHEFSGGMRQRVMIAMATICQPALLVADEPTTALDVTIQAQVLDLMCRLKDKGSLMLITHNLGIVAEFCDDVVVMYAGTVVEKGSMEELFDRPAHPYTRGLMASIPTLSSPKGELYSIPGTVPVSKNFSQGCRFEDRCSHCTERCKKEAPPLQKLGESHYVRCWLDFSAGEEL